MRPETPEILHEEGGFIVILKPAGVSVIPERDTGGQAPPLTELLAPAYGKLLVVHRIDKDTSGLVLMARDKATHAALSLAFQERKVLKAYHALAHGRPDWEEKECAVKLRADGDRLHRTIIDPRRGKATKTVFRLLEPLGPYCLLEARPETGRTHQIRIHASTLGHPILCDPLYGDGKEIRLSDFKRGRRGDPLDERPLLSRLALHALSLEIPRAALDPDGAGEGTLSFQAPYPRDFSALLNQLRKVFSRKAPE